ncbi:hypothetical protein SAMN05216276_111317, partial [Streptosporangium subroseum]
MISLPAGRKEESPSFGCFDQFSFGGEDALVEKADATEEGKAFAFNWLGEGVLSVEGSC